jgi:hypothetical protein
LLPLRKNKEKNSSPNLTQTKLPFLQKENKKRKKKGWLRSKLMLQGTLFYALSVYLYFGALCVPLWYLLITRGWKHWTLGLVGSLLLYVPFLWLSREYVFIRFFVTATATIMNARLLQLSLCVPLDKRRHWTLNRFFVETTTIVREDLKEPRPTRRDGLWILVRLVAKALCLLGLLHVLGEIFVDKAPTLWASPLSFYVHQLAYGLAFYLQLASVSDVGVLFGTLTSDRLCVEGLWNAPYLATSPRDFWGRRWNVLFRHIFHGLIFLPVAKRLGVVVGSLAVFAVSGLLHEFLNHIVFHDASGENLVFFLVHGGACLVQSLVQRSQSLRPLCPNNKVLAWFLNAVFFLTTAPFFFGPYCRAGYFALLKSRLGV